MNELLTPPQPPQLKPACPRCLSTDTVRIWYGFPSPGWFDWEDCGLIEIGGCVVENKDWHCRSCGVQWRIRP